MQSLMSETHTTAWRQGRSFFSHIIYDVCIRRISCTKHIIDLAWLFPVNVARPTHTAHGLLHTWYDTHCACAHTCTRSARRTIAWRRCRASHSHNAAMIALKRTLSYSSAFWPHSGHPEVHAWINQKHRHANAYIDTTYVCAAHRCLQVLPTHKWTLNKAVYTQSQLNTLLEHPLQLMYLASRPVPTYPLAFSTNGATEILVHWSKSLQRCRWSLWTHSLRCRCAGVRALCPERCCWCSSPWDYLW